MDGRSADGSMKEKNLRDGRGRSVTGEGSGMGDEWLDCFEIRFSMC